MGGTEPDRPRAPFTSQSGRLVAFGSGWMSGTIGVALAFIGLGGVWCFHFPSILTSADFRALYPVPAIRALLHLVLVSAFILGAISVALRPHKALGLTAIAATLVAALLGGSRVPIDDELTQGPFLGLDWFLLNLMAYTAVFVPLERAFALRAGQRVLRKGWRTDLTYFFVSTLFLQILTVLTLKPAMVFFDWARHGTITAWLGGLPGIVQFILIVIVADVTQYWAHRAFHRVPILWRFHEIHHSAEVMDWLAGSRLHLVDIVVTRGLTYVPIYVLGFAEGPFFAYLVFVSVQAVFIHANVRFEMRWLDWLLATPQYHHWHHAAVAEAVDKNFAVHLPVLDRVFGTHYMPGRWPDRYGIAAGSTVPPGWGRQFRHAFGKLRNDRELGNDRELKNDRELTDDRTEN